MKAASNARFLACRLLAQPRSQLALLTLFALLQRCPQPLLRLAQVAKQGLEPAARLLQKSTLATAAVGAHHALSGATQFILLPDPPFELQVGEYFELAFGITNTPANASSWKIVGQLPAGLSIAGIQGADAPNAQGILNALAGSISGTPTQSGVFPLSLQPYKYANALGNTTDPLEITLRIEVPAAPTPPPAPTLSYALEGDALAIRWLETEGDAYVLEQRQSDGDWAPVAAAIRDEAGLRRVDIPLFFIAAPVLLRLAPPIGTP